MGTRYSEKSTARNSHFIPKAIIPTCLAFGLILHVEFLTLMGRLRETRLINYEIILRFVAKRIHSIKKVWPTACKSLH